jgi:hypothetical protein
MRKCHPPMLHSFHNVHLHPTTPCGHAQIKLLRLANGMPEIYSPAPLKTTEMQPTARACRKQSRDAQ